MSDEQRLRDALQGAIPEPPSLPDRGVSARLRAGRGRRRRLLTAGAIVLVLAAAVPVVHGLGGAQRDQAALAGTVHGQGPAACRQLTGRDGLGTAVDNRTVDGATAAAWLRSTRSSVDPGHFPASGAVTVCVMERSDTYTVVVVGPTRRAYVDVKGYTTVGRVMQSLDQLWKGGAATTNSPFACPGGSAPDAMNVSTSLPLGATAARICFGGTLFTPRQVLTTRVDDLVRSIDDSPIGYTFPNVGCGGNPDSPTYTLVFDYASGTRTVGWGICGGLDVGPFTRNFQAPDLDQHYLALLQQQVGVPMGSVAPPPCPPAERDAPSGMGDLRHIAAARFCPSGSTGAGIVLSASELATVRTWGDALPQGTTDVEGSCPRPSGGWPHLAVTDTWQNRFTLTLKCRPPRVMVAVLPGWTHGRMVSDVFLFNPLRHLLQQLITTPSR